MADEEKTTEAVEVEASAVKTNKKKSWIALIVGVVLLAVGGISYFQSETVNNVFVEVGAGQVTTGIIEMQPNSRAVFIQVANVIDAAAEARTTDPTTLAGMIDKAVEPYVSILDVSPIVTSVINQINEAHKASDTEEKYILKLQKVAAGIRSAALSVE